MNARFMSPAMHLAHAAEGTIRGAGAIAAADVADRLLMCMWMVEQYDEEDREGLPEAAQRIASELCGYAAIVDETPAYFLRNAAQLYCERPDRDTSIAGALAVLNRVSDQRRAA